MFRPSTCNAALDEALTFLGGKPECKVDHNTYLAYGEEMILGVVVHIEFHRSNILTYSNRGITINSHGYRTATTKERMNAFLPQWVRVSQRGKVWYVEYPARPRTTNYLNPEGNSAQHTEYFREVKFVDGMTLYGKTVVCARKENINAT